MINQEIQEYKNWINLMATNPPKTRGILLNTNGEGCCLGHYCVANNLPKQLTAQRYSFSSNDFASAICLPPPEAKKLNITTEGTFTNDGEHFVAQWIIDNGIMTETISYGKPSALVIINDHTDATHKQIGELIQFLAGIEKEKGIECFIRYDLLH